MFRLRITSLAAAAVAAALALHRPDLGPPTGWSGDQAAVAAAWAVALACSAYLALVTVVCAFATRTQRAGLALGAARFAPRFVRRLVEVALVGTLSIAPSVPAFAAGRPATGDQPVVRTGLSTPVVPTRPSTPVVRTRPLPAPTSTAPRRARAAPTTSTLPPERATPAPRPARPVTPNRAHHSSEPNLQSRPGPASAPATVRTHVVRPGDNLWVIARTELQRRGAADPADAATARYLRQVIASNVKQLRSGDPNLIFPGEVVALPEPA